MKKDLLKSIRQEHVLEGFIGNHPNFTNLKNKIKNIAQKNVSVLLIGETGTGKGRCAEFIHHYSDRFDCPFIPYNCGSGPETLFESQIFGYMKGAFTGADRDRVGLVKEAHSGILFLDEINSLNRNSQVKLNFFLETGFFRPLGETQLQYSDVRIIAASNVDLHQEMNQGRFREDLYYRLAEYELFVPPLRCRKDDIPLLVEYFVGKYSHLNSDNKIRFSLKAMHNMMEYTWPGNIRELENFLKRTIINSTSNIVDSISLPNYENTSESYNCRLSYLTLKEAKRKLISLFENEYLRDILKTYKGVVAQCARHAGIHPSDFWKLMRKHKLKAKDFRNIES